MRSHLVRALLVLALARVVPAASWTPIVQINYNYGTGAGTPDCAVSPVNGTPYATYQVNWDTGNGNAYVIGFARGVPNFQTRTFDWSGTHNTRIEVSPRGHKDLNAAITVGSRNGQEIIYISWLQHIGDEDIHAAFSKDGGATWSADVDLSGTGVTGSGTASQSTLAADDQGNVFCVWTDWIGNTNANNLDIWFRHGTYNGTTVVWDAKKKLESNPNTKSLYPKIFRQNNGRLHFIWADRLVSPPRLSYTSSSDNGATFTPIETVFTATPTYDMSGAAVAVDSSTGVIYAATATPAPNGGPDDLYLCTKPPGGIWSAPVASPGADPNANAWLVADNSGHIYLSYLHYGSTFDMVVTTHSSLGWGCPFYATNDSLWKGYTGGHVVVDSVHGFLHVVTDDTPTGNHEMYVTTLDLHQPPAGPTQFNASAGSTEVTLNWNVPKDPVVSSYHIVRRTDRYPASPTDGVVLPEGLATCSTLGRVIDSGLTNGTRYYYALYLRSEAAIFSPAAIVSGLPAGPGDFDRDGDVDQSDFAHLQLCVLGSSTPQYDTGCANALLNNDLYVDQNDLSIFLKCMSGPDVYARPDCAQ